MQLEDGTDSQIFRGFQLHGDSLALDHALKTTAQVGVGALSLFEHLFPERFRILGIDSGLEALKWRL